jgi:probable phosphoglycerate mutase
VRVEGIAPARVQELVTAATPADPGLADLGIAQSARLADYLASEAIAAIYASPARRAIETAVPLGTTLGREIRIDAGLAECDASDPSYIPVEELRSAGDPRWLALRRGELYESSVDMVAYRRTVVGAVEAIIARHPGRRVVLFAHAGTINAYVGEVLGQLKPFWLPMTGSPAYASISRIAAARDGQRSVISINETGHVRDLLPGVLARARADTSTPGGVASPVIPQPEAR